MHESKQLDLADHINMVSLDIFLLMETWLNEDADSIWKASSELNLNGIHLDTVDWANEKKGGGITIVYKDNIKTKKINTSQFNCFESCVRKLDVNNCSILVMIIYQPPQSCRSITPFSDKFLELYTTIASFGKNIIIAGDFNIYTGIKMIWIVKNLDTH